MKERVSWVDNAKFLGIFFIYLGHFTDAAGLAYKFVFCFHVALFFFLSGCTSNYDSEENFGRFVIKRFKRILLPFYVFALASILLNAIYMNWGFMDIRASLILVAKGCVRNQFIAPPLWFLSCLFVMEIVFKLLKMIKNKPIILVISGVLFIITKLFIFTGSTTTPSWPYNVDTMLYYIVFYALGYCLYPLILKLFELDTRVKSIIFYAVLLCSTLYAAMLFVGVSLLSRVVSGELAGFIIPIVQPLIMIVFVLCVAKLLDGVQLFTRIGRETLYLCGNEFMIKTSFAVLLPAFGLSLTLENPLQVYLYTILLIYIAYKWIIPLEKEIANAVKKNLHW